MKALKYVICFAMTLIILITPVFALNTPIPAGTVVPQASAPIIKAIPALAKPDSAKVLALAEKYYNLGLSKASAHEKLYIPTIISWKPDFKGKAKDPAKAAQYLTSSAYLTSFTDLKGIYLPLNAAVFALDTGNAAAAGNLASSIAAYSEDTAAKPLGEALISNKEAKPYAEDAAAVYEYALGLKLKQPVIDISALPLLLNYGYLCIDRGKFDPAKTVLEAAYNLAPGHMPAIEGMAAYWLAKGDKAKAKKLLEGTNLSVMNRNLKKMQEDVSEQKAPLVSPGESHEVSQNKLRTLDKIQPVLATDFYENLDPEGAQSARHFVDSLYSSLHYTAPDFNYLSQYSTLKNFNSQGGISAFEAFNEELMRLEEEVASKEIDETVLDAMEQQLDQIDNDPNRDPEHLAAMYTQLALQNPIMPEMAILAVDPDNYVNPTDIISQQYNVIELRRKWESYRTYIIMQCGELQEVIAPASDDLERKVEPKSEAMFRELDELKDEHDASHDDDDGECDPCVVKRHDIHSEYDPQLNNLTETAWMDVTNFVNSRYTQRIKPNMDAMYIECMKNILLISDPAVRAKVEERLGNDLDQLTTVIFNQVRQAYSIYLISYPYECDCNLAAVEAASERQRKEIEAAEAQKISMHMKAKQAFEAGEIPENSQLYQRLDKYSATCNLMFTKIKMHPLKTEVAMEVNIPGTNTGVSGKMTENHIRNTTAYDGGITVGVGSADAAGGSIGASASVSLKGEMTVDGKGNVVSADVAGSATGTVSVLGTEASGTYEASVQRGCKLSGEVARIQSDFVRINVPEELDTFRPDKPEQAKKVLWQGEYQVK